LSIGEVLALLQDEFPDVTISKIRFLESQGLIDPERTPSGYRKFYDPDVERLRFILREQKEHFLPLKVIKDRLDSGDPEVAGEPAERESAEPPDEPATDGPRIPIWMVKGAETETEPHIHDGGELTFTFEELAVAAQLSADELREVERFGLISGRQIGGTTIYDEHSLGVARAAAGFWQFGVEPRHLRLYRNAADREAGLIEQVIMPFVKQRNPRAHNQAVSSMEELARLGGALREAMLHQALRRYL
jgi:DNA-binding transcriptional MerR regulator